jgi:hypothetical protein
VAKSYNGNSSVDNYASSCFRSDPLPPPPVTLKSVEPHRGSLGLKFRTKEGSDSRVVAAVFLAAHGRQTVNLDARERRFRGIDRSCFCMNTMAQPSE